MVWRGPCRGGQAPHGAPILKGSWDLVSRVISTLIGVISIVTLIITLVTKSHDPLSKEAVTKFPSPLSPKAPKR